ncbi:MAG TPA: amidase [Terriglobales bacterium]|nr:amidase [Terriglobales bacterium]
MQTLLELSQMFRNHSASPVEITSDCLSRIKRLNPVLKAFITVTGNSALEQARSAEAEIHAGRWRGPLHGVPLGLKDIIDTQAVRTTAASAVFKDRVPARDADVVSRLQQAGAVFLGKQNLHEFAYGGSSVISYFGEVRNAWNVAHIAGGSSGGSATSVAAGLGYGTVGTDTAGSIRDPASLCGVVGIKPTYGRVSARGVIPLSQSLDHVGPLARTIADTAALLQAIAGYDAEDPASVDVPVPDYLGALDQPLGRTRIGVPRHFFFDELDPEIAAAVKNALEVFTSMRAEIREIKLEVPTDRTLQAAESYDYHRKMIARSPGLYQPETLRRIRTGENTTAEEIEKARRELAHARHEIASVFEHVDVLITPTVPIATPMLQELKQHPEQLRPRELALLRNTRPINVWGLPAISLPCGFTKAGLPIGLQIVGPHWEEVRVFQVGYAYERATAWHKRMPAIMTS